MSWQKRPTYMAKETYLHEVLQKRPMHMAKETYVLAKETYS